MGKVHQMSSAWIESDQAEVKDIEKKFEDNFVSEKETFGNFQKLEDSDDYLKILGKHVVDVC